MNIKFPFKLFDNTDSIRSKLVELFNYEDSYDSSNPQHETRIENNSKLQSRKSMNSSLLPEIHTPNIKNQTEKTEIINNSKKLNHKLSLNEKQGSNSMKINDQELQQIKKPAENDKDIMIFEAHEDQVNSLSPQFVNLGSLPYLSPGKSLNSNPKNTNLNQIIRKKSNDNNSINLGTPTSQNKKLGNMSVNEMYDDRMFTFYPNQNELNSKFKMKNQIDQLDDHVSKRKNISKIVTKSFQFQDQRGLKY